LLASGQDWRESDVTGTFTRATERATNAAVSSQPFHLCVASIQEHGLLHRSIPVNSNQLSRLHFEIE
jgi:hypothetical protein